MSSDLLYDLAIRELIVCEPAFINQSQYLPWLAKHKELFCGDPEKNMLSYKTHDWLYFSVNRLTNYIEYNKIAKQALREYRSLAPSSFSDLINWLAKYSENLGSDVSLVCTEFDEDNPQYKGYKNLCDDGYEVFYSLDDIPYLVEFDRIYTPLYWKYSTERHKLVFNNQLKELKETAFGEYISSMQQSMHLIGDDITYLHASQYLPWLEKYKLVYSIVWNCTFKDYLLIVEFAKLYSELEELERLLYFNEKAQLALDHYRLFVEPGHTPIAKWIKQFEDLYGKSLSYMSCEIANCDSKYVNLYGYYEKVFIKVNEFSTLRSFYRLFRQNRNRNDQQP